MNNTKLVLVLKTLDNTELKQFSEYLGCSYFNTNQSLVHLLDKLAGHWPDFTDEACGKERIFRKLFPGEPFKAERIRYLSSELLDQLERFLAFSVYQKRTSQQHYYLLTELYARGLDNLFEIRLKEAEKYLTKQETELWNLHAQFLIDDIQIDHLQHKYLGQEFMISKKSDYTGSLTSLNAFYLLYSLKLQSVFLTHSSIYSHEKKLALDHLEKIIEILRGEQKNIPKVVEMYIINTRLLARQEEEDYIRLKDFVFSDELDNIHKFDQQNFFTTISGYCRNKYAEGDLGYLQKTLSAYKAIILKKLFLQNGFMPPVLFSNIVMLSIDAKEANLAEKFIKEYAKFLPPEQSESVVGFCMANISYCKKEYKSALSYLKNARYESPLRQMAIKNLLLKIYFDKGEHESVLPLIDSYKHAIKQIGLLSEKSKAQFSKFIQYFQKLYKLRSGPDKSKLEPLYKAIEKEKNLAQKIWLLEKTAELMRR
ncbi:MAG: hypothetical protein ACJ76F_06205 [Bacteroidia bacterium]